MEFNFRSGTAFVLGLLIPSFVQWWDGKGVGFWVPWCSLVSFLGGLLLLPFGLGLRALLPLCTFGFFPSCNGVFVKKNKRKITQFVYFQWKNLIKMYPKKALGLTKEKFEWIFVGNCLIYTSCFMPPSVAIYMASWAPIRKEEQCSHLVDGRITIYI